MTLTLTPFNPQNPKGYQNEWCIKMASFWVSKTWRFGTRCFGTCCFDTCLGASNFTSSQLMSGCNGLFAGVMLSLGHTPSITLTFSKFLDFLNRKLHQNLHLWIYSNQECNATGPHRSAFGRFHPPWRKTPEWLIWDHPPILQEIPLSP